MQDRAFANPKIEFRWNTAVTEMLGDTKVSGVCAAGHGHRRESELDVTGLFVAIGHEPNTSLLKGQLELEDNGYVRTFGGTTRTSVDGRLRLRRRAGRLLPPGRHLGRLGLHGRHRRRALARDARASSGGNRTGRDGVAPADKEMR